MFLFGISDQAGGFDPLILLLMALVIETYVGQLQFLAKLTGHPMQVLESFINWLDRKLNRETRSQMDRAIRGGLSATAVIIICLAIGWGVAWLSQMLPFAWMVEMILLVMLIGQRATYSTIRNIGLALRDQGLEAARQSITPLVSEAPDKMDSHGIARAGIETSAIALSTRVIAPVFWYVLFGFPGLLTYHGIMTMNKLIGHRTEKHQAFGFTAARLNDILLLIPAQLSGLFVVLASIFVPTAHPGRALKIMLRDARKYRNYNLGVTLAAIAGAFNFALAGPRKFSQATKNEHWLGDGTAQVTHQDIRRVLYLFATACLINAAWVAALTIVRYS